GQQDYTTPWTF
nr:immunoglobulin light chain junction region [Macaca mulatta]